MDLNRSDAVRWMWCVPVLTSQGLPFHAFDCHKLTRHSLEPEVAHVHKTWTYVGGAAGAALGFIVANAAGAVAGGELPDCERT